MRRVYLVRHGETDWSRSGRHTSAWMLFRDGCPGGERPDQVQARVASSL